MKTRGVDHLAHGVDIATAIEPEPVCWQVDAMLLESARHHSKPSLGAPLAAEVEVADVAIAQHVLDVTFVLRAVWRSFDPLQKDVWPVGRFAQHLILSAHAHLANLLVAPVALGKGDAIKTALWKEQDH